MLARRSQNPAHVTAFNGSHFRELGSGPSRRLFVGACFTLDRYRAALGRATPPPRAGDGG